METLNPIAVFWTGLIFTIILGLGLLTDIILATIYWGKWPRPLKGNLANVPWSFRDVLKISIALVFLYGTFYLAEYLILKLGLVTRSGLKPVASVCNTLGIYGLGIWIISRFLKQNYHVGWQALGLRWRRWWQRSLKGSLFYLGFLPVLAILVQVSIILCSRLGLKPEPHPLVEILKKEKSILFISYLMIVATFIAPIFEEILFRGLLYQGLKRHVGILPAVFIASIIFSLLHFNTAQFLPVMGLGVLLCLIFEYTGSLVPAIAVHMLNNGVFLGLFLILKQ